MPISTYERAHRLNRFRGTASPSVPGSYYVSLHSADPGKTGASELSGNGYARVAIPAASGEWTSPTVNGSVDEIENVDPVAFAAATGSDWSAATHFGIWDALTTGNFIRGAALASARTVLVGDTLTFAAGELVLNES